MIDAIGCARDPYGAPDLLWILQYTASLLSENPLRCLWSYIAAASSLPGDSADGSPDYGGQSSQGRPSAAAAAE